MTSDHTPGGFSGDPAAALDVAGTGGCCGNPPQATLTLPAVDGPDAAAPCCGTMAEAARAGACCGTSAKAEAVASGAGCCG
ncbi:hypothetical protein Daura_18835 [Dactylosporangium aurantiacum]|uniref:Uncharacterized protein n=1 Tax=Dactylosporangium aurantiacum TaxID=35754 RepID=A0A9Q9IRF2_9ACTN|nr:hypothetical protein [Dactylosporangium aurantiacum]MDG6105771.1 hypothetical protein [Dactylosporangium aurantiacum]UWZ58039.1 hypothetical protein Daura_18835 [Dactylosporangium aurantiacum]